MTLSHKIRQFLISLVLKERSSTKLAFSFCIGVYIAFSPFVGFHTLGTILAIWALNLNAAVTFAASCLIHNPWTTIPVYGIDYIFGDWLLTDVFGLDAVSMNPAWMSFINDPLQTYLGLSNVSFWSFMVGGNVLGLFFSIGLYPFMKNLFARMIDQVHGGEISATRVPELEV
ncbi:MAG TPA: DUF2062 domain-containing protein [Candidatus Babeliales bacterium]|nr:DUF2062 domain-containing protein [Candidatus Babeliales bacterium]